MAKRKASAAQCCPGPQMTKREAILQAALEVFLESGYAAANMDALAARAGVSKATIYAYFKGKDELFGELIRLRCESCFGPLVAPDVQVQDEAGVKAALRQLAHGFWTMVTAPEALGAYRIVIAEAPRFPEVGKAFYQTGPAKGLEALTGFFADLDRRGLLTVPEPRTAAEFFVGMLRSDLYLRRLLGLEDGAQTVDALVDAVVEMLYRAYAPPQV